jgi:hypothetical protein
MFDNRIRRIATDGTVTTIAGTGVQGYSGEGGPAAQAQISFPITVAVDHTGTVYFETSDSRVMKVTPDGVLHLVAGSGTGTGLNRAGGDGGPAVNATLNVPKGLAIDAQGNVYIGDTTNARLRKVDSNGIITTAATPGVIAMDYWNAVAIDPQGNLYVGITHSFATTFWSEVDRVNADGSLTRVAGNAQSCGNLPQTTFTFDGAPALATRLCLILGLTFDTQGVMYIPESFYDAVLRVAPDGTISRVAGSISSGGLGDGGSPLLASLQGGSYYSPASVAIDAAGNMLLPQSARIREVFPGPLKVALSQARVDFQSASPKSQSIQVLTNIAEPLPFGVQVKSNGGAWLTANRVTGQTGDLLTLSVNTAGLASGVYTASVQISVPVGAASASVAVTLTLP